MRSDGDGGVRAPRPTDKRKAPQRGAIPCHISAKPKQAGQAHRSAPHKIPRKSQGVYLTFTPLPAPRRRGLVRRADERGVSQKVSSELFEYLGGTLSPLDIPRDKRYEFIHVNRLRHMVIHADRQRLFAVLGKGVRRHRDNRDVRLLRVAEPAYHLGRRVAVLYRHLNVHQNERIVPRRRFVQLFRAVHAVFRAVNDKSDLAQHRNRDFRVQVVVLREKNALAAQNTHIRAVPGFFRLRVLERREPARHMAKRTAKKTANSGVRFDDKRTRLKTGEIQRKNGTYEYRWTTRDGKRHSVYAPTLDKLREYEEQVIVDRHDGIKTDVKALSVNDVFDLWCNLKRGVKDSTMKNYIYMYEMFVRPTFGKKRLVTVKKSDVRGFYNRLADEKIPKISTIDGIHNVLHQVFQVAVDDEYIRNNPTDNMLKELKQAHCMDSEKRKALTMEEKKSFWNT